MSGPSTYLRYELLRTLRNWPFLVLSVAFPLLLLLVVGSANRHAHLDGISFPLYYMVGMASWGAMGAVVATGARIAAERQGKWTRQLRLTPLRAPAYLGAKIVTGYVMALLTLGAIYSAGSLIGVRLSALGWVWMTGLILVGLIPFAIAGIALGHVLRPEVLGPAIGGLTSLLALVGGAWGPLLSGSLLSVAKAFPSYWLVQAGIAGLDRHPWGIAGWLVVAVWALVLLPLAALAYRRDTARV